MTVTVALPVRNGGALLGDVLTAVRAQDVELELLVIDSGSTDGSQELARRHGARVVEIPHAEFSHGGTRNRLMELAGGDHVAFLTQDSVPAGPGWLGALLGGFALADDVALSFGPHLPRPDASPMVRRELRELFARFGDERVDRGANALGPATFFSSANGAVARWAWERVPFRPVGYAEDQALARDMLAAGLAKAYVPEAARDPLARPASGAGVPPLLRGLPRARRGQRAARAAHAALHRGPRARRRCGGPGVHAR